MQSRRSRKYVLLNTAIPFNHPTCAFHLYEYFTPIIDSTQENRDEGGCVHLQTTSILL